MFCHGKPRLNPKKRASRRVPRIAQQHRSRDMRTFRDIFHNNSGIQVNIDESRNDEFGGNVEIKTDHGLFILTGNDISPSYQPIGHSNGGFTSGCNWQEVSASSVEDACVQIKSLLA